MQDDYSTDIIEGIELRANCESVGIMITALILNNDIVHNDDNLKKAAKLAIVMINKIAQQINQRL